ncbi:MAG: hypothetical protein QXS20_05850 [Candidatus Thorarchaeota archaeon]
MNDDRFMIMDYLVPLLNGCRVALRMGVADVEHSRNMTEDEFNRHLESVEPSLRNISVCFVANDTDERASIVFDDGVAEVSEDCFESDVVVSADLDTLIEIFSSDPRVTVLDILEEDVDISGSNHEDVIEVLGLMCYPALCKMARDGVDPTSVLSEDAYAVVMAAASDLVTKAVRLWIDRQLRRGREQGRLRRDRDTERRVP